MGQNSPSFQYLLKIYPVNSKRIGSWEQGNTTWHHISSRKSVHLARQLADSAYSCWCCLCSWGSVFIPQSQRQEKKKEKKSEANGVVSGFKAETKRWLCIVLFCIQTVNFCTTDISFFFSFLPPTLISQLLCLHLTGKLQRWYFLSHSDWMLRPGPEASRLWSH